MVSICYQIKCDSTFRPALNSARKKCPRGYARQPKNGKPRRFERIQVSHYSRYEAIDNAKHVSYSLTKWKHIFLDNWRFPTNFSQTWVRQKRCACPNGSGLKLTCDTQKWHDHGATRRSRDWPYAFFYWIFLLTQRTFFFYDETVNLAIVSSHHIHVLSVCRTSVFLQTTCTLHHMCTSANRWSRPKQIADLDQSKSLVWTANRWSGPQHNRKTAIWYNDSHDLLGNLLASILTFPVLTSLAYSL